MELYEFLTAATIAFIVVHIWYRVISKKCGDAETLNIYEDKLQMLCQKVKMLERQREIIIDKLVELEEKVRKNEQDEQDEQEVHDSLIVSHTECHKELLLAYFQEVTSLSNHNEDLKQQVQILSKQNAVMQNYIDEHICRRNKSECKNHD